MGFLPGAGLGPLVPVKGTECFSIPRNVDNSKFPTLQEQLSDGPLESLLTSLVNCAALCY